ncbi:xanthine dehydrogenase accessory protein XdhC [Turneriella parva]|uniref:Xanthine dehydrogenase accessory protein XdhC n=1 Tax=Turneriella parva (strain ATCC BAA-1111 / DSM 21527 / NCTC 11395 / H) TaxID=869212 RepID=I4B3S6_TURPD|nr:xanthine dehydrogenase accessory protein XdhC [Turneriella parva]AFM11933.1 xanthine dehydrogenase accessory protein XdhC [Turneriella parva DSM 21527]
MFWQKHHELLESGRPFVLVILTEALGSAPQESGAKMLCDANGLIYGTIGGGKVEALALKTAADLLTNKSTTVFVDWHLERDVGMTCGGRVKLYFETYRAADWQIAIFGAGHVAQAVVAALLPLTCRIVCIDSRQDWLESLPESPQLERRLREAPAMEIHSLAPETFVLMMTQGHATDFPVLLECMKREQKFPYVGAIGSKSKRAVLVKELIAAGVDAHQADLFTCPIGLPLGKSEPAEIAVSVVAQLIQVRDARRADGQEG